MQPSPQLSKRFVLRRCLGSGGMGAVYEALDNRRGALVALKALTKLSPSAVSFLKREFRLASELRHPNLVRFYDLFSSTQQTFFTMELILGQRLDLFVRGEFEEKDTLVAPPPTQLLPETSPTRRSMENHLEPSAAIYSLERLLLSLPQLCAALDCLHQAGVIHRDLKPGNILVAQDGDSITLKLLDFGVAQTSATWDATERRLSHAGTSFYMSPEQVQGRRLTPASDLYSLGAVLFQMLAGRPPFLYDSSSDIMAAHIREEVPLLSQFAPQAPRELEEVCRLLLSKDPEKRPSSREVVDRLSALGAPSPIWSKPRVQRFVGRSQERAELSATLDVVHSGSARLVLVEGEPGAGKSSFCAEQIRQLEAEGWRIVASRCYEREAVPYNALDPIIDSVVASLRARPDLQAPEGLSLLQAMFPVLRDVTWSNRPAEGEAYLADREEGKAALRRLLAIFGEGRPVALLFDDLQWADQDSISLLRGLLSWEQPYPLLILGTSRSNAQGEVEALLQERAAQRIHLSSFGSDDIAALSGGLFSPEVIAQITREASGNAFLANELICARIEGEEGGQSLRSLLDSRARKLSHEQQLTLEAAAVAGGAILFVTLQQVTGLTPQQLSSSLDSLRGARWIKAEENSEDEAFDIYHDRLREAVYESLPAEKRVVMHSSFAEAMQSDGEPEVVAGHHLRAKQPTLSALWLLRAARKAATQLAPERSADLYARALSIGGPTWQEAQRAREERSLVLDRAGGFGKEAARAFRDAASYTSGATAVSLLTRAADAELKQGAIDEALSAARQAMIPYGGFELPSSKVGAFARSALGTLDIERRIFMLGTLPNRRPSAELKQRHVLYQRFSGSLIHFDLLRGATLLVDYLSMALREGSDEEVVMGVVYYAYLVANRRGRKNFARANQLFARCRSWRHVIEDPELLLFMDTLDGLLSFLEGRFDDSKRQLLPVLEQAKRLHFRSGSQVALPVVYLSSSQILSGDLISGAALLARYYQKAKETGDGLSCQILGPLLQWATYMRGELDLPSIAEPLPFPSYSGLQMATNRALVALARGEAQRSCEILEKLLSEKLSNGLLIAAEYQLRIQQYLAVAYLARARTASGHSSRKHFLQQAEACVQPSIDCDDPFYEGAAFRVAGLIAAAKGEKDAAIRWLTRAVNVLAGRPMHLASALLARASVTGDNDDIERGNAILTRGGFADPALLEGDGWSWR